MKKCFINDLRKSKIFYFSIFLIIISWIKVFLGLINDNVVGEELALITYESLIPSYFITLIIIPSVIVLNDTIISLYDNKYIIFRYADIKEWWREKVKCGTLIALIYVGIINFLMLIIFIYTGVDIIYLEKIVLAILFQTLGIIIVSLVYMVIKSLIKNRYIAMFITIFIFFSLLLFQYSFYYIKYVPILQDYMNLSYVIEGHSTWVGLLVNILALSLLYIGGGCLNYEKDFY